ncbi:MAG: V4R protein [archaeon GW2011_AR10]|uniref:4-vinyl reductase 4VR domain-containing protein n=1 Tax=Candidatus Iainarchaeum sp. TaxID=3101447 RepID=A0A7J4J028_9ARCH|nr:MAG: V4R protein [archaeon GW2011_AR10]HIH08586.1 hypothetical protein [Candidatus Diapherotrites archaeon]
MQKLVLAKQIKFDQGKIELLNQKLSIFPVSVFSTIVDNNPKVVPDVYQATKESAQMFANEIKKRHKFTGQQLKSWLKDIVSFAGWGKAEFIIYDEKNFASIVRVQQSPVAEISKKKGYTDHALRGFFAGGGSASMETDLDCIEIKCVAKGDSICEFVLGKKQILKKDHPEFFKSQLWWLNEK